MLDLHDILIRLRNDLGYKKENAGVCVLYVESAINAFLVGEYIRVFKPRFDFIRDNHKHFPALFKRMEHENRLHSRFFVSSRGRKTYKKTPYATPSRFISRQHRKILQEIMACMDKGELYLNPEYYPDFFGRPLGQSHIDYVSPYVESINLEHLKGRVNLASFCGVYPKKILVEYMQQLNDLAKVSPYDFALSLCGDNHRAGFCYSVAEKNWLFLDIANPDALPIPADEDASVVMANVVMKSFEDELAFNTAFNTELYTTGEHKVVMQEQVNTWMQAKALIAIHEITLAHAKQKTSRGITLAWLAARKGDAMILKSIVELRPYIDLNQANMDGVAPVYVAAQSGHTDALAVLINAKMTDGTPRTDLDRANPSGSPIMIAAYLGYFETVDMLLMGGASFLEDLSSESLSL